MKKQLYCLLFLLGAQGVSAQEVWTLRRAIDYAIENNIEIKQQEVTVSNSEITLNTSKNSRLPNLSGGVSQNINLGRSPSLETGIYEDNRSSSTSFSLSSSVPVFAGMRLNNEIKQNELNLKAATENLEKAKENLELQVTSLYLQALFRKEILRVNLQQAELTRQQVERTRVLVESEKVPRAQLADIEAQLAQDELNVVNADNDLALALLNLSQALNLLYSKDFDIYEPEMNDVIAENQHSIRPPEDIYRIAVGIKPHVREAEYLLESSNRSLLIAKGAFWPTISMGVSYNNGFSQILGKGAVNRNVSTQLKNNQREAIGLNMNIPIFNRLSTRNQVSASRNNILNYELNLENVKLVLFKEIQQAYQSAIAAQSRYMATEKAFLAAEIAFASAEIKYSAGKSTVFEYNDAQNRLFSSRSEQLQAKYDFLFRAKILDFYRGIEIDI